MSTLPFARHGKHSRGMRHPRQAARQGGEHDSVVMTLKSAGPDVTAGVCSLMASQPWIPFFTPFRWSETTYCLGRVSLSEVCEIYFPLSLWARCCPFGLGLGWCVPPPRTPNVNHQGYNWPAAGQPRTGWRRENDDHGLHRRDRKVQNRLDAG